MSDKTIRCIECGQDFIFEDGEQQFYARNSFHDPKRCKPCREENKRKKAERQDAVR
jgi:hypothetical protein